MMYGDKIRYAREKLGMSMTDFAAAIGMTYRSIANIENCKDSSKKLSYDKMEAIIVLAELRGSSE